MIALVRAVILLAASKVSRQSVVGLTSQATGVAPAAETA